MDYAALAVYDPLSLVASICVNAIAWSPLFEMVCIVLIIIIIYLILPVPLQSSELVPFLYDRTPEEHD